MSNEIIFLLIETISVIDEYDSKIVKCHAQNHIYCQHSAQGIVM